MIVLALDCSSPVCSLALTRGENVLGVRDWSADGRSRQQLFPHLESLLRDAGVTAAAINLIAVGRGPGNFSGLRSSMAAAQAMALPDGKPVLAVSSGRMVAASAFAADPALARIRVLGDARRGTLWYADFSRPGPGDIVAPSEWRLASGEELLRDAVPSVTSDPARLLAAYPRVSETLAIGEALTPSAPVLASLARAEHARGLSHEPFAPVYMHPAVL